ncbi:hypothetical protein MSAN_00305100 [Mycena sanguinolenta]|uniref:Uncharacterized protein n=1 Tax=Mycena sanguinolenta TaxID=230812 RepID=A0A8H6ZBJ0_9AGAR|nr:hypothetical protein MSAN_00305100 [Mycena sanguinolenta]
MSRGLEEYFHGASLGAQERQSDLALGFVHSASPTASALTPSDKYRIPFPCGCVQSAFTSGFRKTLFASICVPSYPRCGSAFPCTPNFSFFLVVSISLPLLTFPRQSVLFDLLHPPHEGPRTLGDVFPPLSPLYYRVSCDAGRDDTRGRTGEAPNYLFYAYFLFRFGVKAEC